MISNILFPNLDDGCALNPPCLFEVGWEKSRYVSHRRTHPNIADLIKNAFETIARCKIFEKLLLYLAKIFFK